MDRDEARQIARDFEPGPISERVDRTADLILEVDAEARKQVAREAVEIAMERCRLLNGDAVKLIRSGSFNLAGISEGKADQFEWIANEVTRKFGLGAGR